MKLSRPIRSNYVTQRFGENKACIRTDTHGNIRFPTEVVSASYAQTPGYFCPVGYKKFYPAIGLLGHNGIDMATWYSEPVFHCADFNGWVRIEHDTAGGLGVDVVSLEPLLQCTEPNCDQKHHIKARYWHNLDFRPLYEGGIPPRGQHVNLRHLEVVPGQQIARSDSTGASSGNHVHFAPKWCDASGKGLHEDNGYRGAFDPAPFWDERFVLDALDGKQQTLSALDLLRRVLFRLSMHINDIFR